MTEPYQRDNRFEVLLDHIKTARGFDFTGYKRSSLARRFRKRMQELDIEDFLDYAEYLQLHPEEFKLLFNTILINVTGFFRDAESWKYLQETVIPSLVASKSESDSIRIWSAGCASGEEAYSLAIFFCEALGVERFQQRVKIYATDVDEEALSHARLALYTLQALEDVPPEILEKYFIKSGERLAFRPELRRAIIFGRHDLVQDPPISRLDLLLCRNTLMYFNTETQRRILSRFHFALNEDGFLFLGKAEMLLSHTSIFKQIDLKNRVFGRVPSLSLRNNLLALAQTSDPKTYNLPAKNWQLREQAIEAGPDIQLIVDGDGYLVCANLKARQTFNVRLSDIGRQFHDLEISYRPLELRSLIEQAIAERHPVKAAKIERTVQGVPRQLFDVEVCPLIWNLSDCLGVRITFQDVTQFQKLYDVLQTTHEALETGNEELQSAHEGLETANEELQSSNEELETTNEELQSTNEELDTMNEELQLTNVKLESTNNELRALTGELNRANVFLHSILASLKSAIVVVDRETKIQIWNYRAEDMWGLRADEVIGKTLQSLDIGLPVNELAEPIRTFLKTNEQFLSTRIAARTRRGRPIQCTIKMAPLKGNDNIRPGLVLLMDGDDQQL